MALLHRRIAIARFGLIFAGERGPDLPGVSGAFGAEGTPPPNHGSALTCGDGINLVDNQPAIADRSLSENCDRPCRSQGLS